MAFINRERSEDLKNSGEGQISRGRIVVDLRAGWRLPCLFWVELRRPRNVEAQGI